MRFLCKVTVKNCNEIGNSFFSCSSECIGCNGECVGNTVSAVIITDLCNRVKRCKRASLLSVVKISYDDCRDGISNTFSITPEALGADKEARIDNLVAILDGYFLKRAHHINVNVINRETLMKAYENPELYPNLTIRVSGYAVNFAKLSREQQREVISRTFHENI